MAADSSQLDLWNGWHTRVDACDPEPFHRSFRLRFLGETLKQDVSPCRVLELGCGQGADAVHFAKLGCQVDGLDFSPVAIKRATALAVGATLDVRFHCRDTTQPLPFDDGDFAGVFSYLSLHYFDDHTTGAIFKEISRVTRPGGVLAFSVRSVEDPLFGVGTQIGPNMFRNRGHIRHFFSLADAMAFLDSWQILQVEMRRVRYLDMRSPPGGVVMALATKPAGLKSEISDR